MRRARRGKAPQHRVRRCGPQPKRPQKRPEEARAGQRRPEFARNHGGSVETQGNSRPHRVRRCSATWPPGQSKPEEAGIRAKPQRERAREFARNHDGSVETKAPPHRVRRYCGPQPLSGPQKRPQQARRGRNSRETTVGASKSKGIRAKPRRERRNAREFARNHSGSMETKAPPHRVRRCGPQPKQPPQEEAGIRSGSVETQGNSR